MSPALSGRGLSVQVPQEPIVTPRPGVLATITTFSFLTFSSCFNRDRPQRVAWRSGTELTNAGGWIECGGSRPVYVNWGAACDKMGHRLQSRTVSAVKGKPHTRVMPFAVRPLEDGDVTQSAAIERDAFPTLFPPTSFRRELKNRLASYLVACRDDTGDDANVPTAPTSPEEGDSKPLIRRLLRTTRNLGPGRPSASQPARGFIAGFLGIWYMVDEAHIVSFGVRNAHRGRGIGELLLIAAIEQATARQAKVVTLEVRVSNHVAKNLYRKFGFKERGIRKGYYADNREDAIIMTTDPIRVSPYPERFEQLVRTHRRRWGETRRVLS